MTSRIRTRHLVAAGVPVALVAGAVLAPGSAVAAPKMAPAIKVQNDTDKMGITAQGQTQGQLGGTYHITGEHWCFSNKTGGQWIGVKLLDGPNADDGVPVNMDTAHQSVPLPDGTNNNNYGKRGVIAMLKASDDPTGQGNCSVDATVTLPTTQNSDATDARFPQGSQRSLVMLAGSFGPAAANGGSGAHAVTLGMVVGDPIDDGAVTTAPTTEPTTSEEPTTSAQPTTTTSAQPTTTTSAQPTTTTSAQPTTTTSAQPTTTTSAQPPVTTTSATTAPPVTSTTVPPVTTTSATTTPPVTTTTVPPVTTTSATTTPPVTSTTVPPVTTTTSARPTTTTSAQPTATTTSPTKPSTSAPAPGGSLDGNGIQGLPSLGLLGILGIGGFIAGVLAGLFTPILQILGIR